MRIGILILFLNLLGYNQIENEIITNCSKKTTDSIIENDFKSLIIPFNEYQIELITTRDDFELLEKVQIINDTLIISGHDAAEFQSIEIKNLKRDEYRVSQMWESSLILQFDGKAFELKNWKKYRSNWFDINERENIKVYTEKEHQKFPEYSKTELLKALEINKEFITQHFYDFVIENINKTESEVFFEPIITKTIFKIDIYKDENIYIELEHMIGC